MSRCQFCPRQADDDLHGVYQVCHFCKDAFQKGFDTGRVYESERKRINPRKLKKGIL